jgi:hypothetical protein
MHHSGLDTWSNLGSKSGKGFNSLRKVFLPPYQARNEICACFSPFGIIRLAFSQELSKGRGATIIHSQLILQRLSVFDPNLLFSTHSLFPTNLRIQLS